MTTLSWPADCLPYRLSLHVRSLTGRFASHYTGQVQVLERPGARWVGELDLELPLDRALTLEAFLAAVRGPAVPFLFPDLLRDGARGSLKSMDAYAAEIGPTGFDDGTGFHDGHLFYEGAGTRTVLGGKGDRIALDGFAPHTAEVLLDGDPMQLGPGRAHLALGAGSTNVNGYLALTITPRLREPPVRGTLVTSGITILMRLAEDGAAENPTARSRRGQYAIALVEAAGDSITGGGSP
ncbi:MAG: hypothetical protein GVY13_15485 [Alphaproteobacteria bacterium]|jgi:hypothetical protein|nr:hypothetical protein [Alphaproteobacteria bacterium]